MLPVGNIQVPIHFLRGQDNQTVAHKKHPKGDVGRQPEASFWRRSPQSSILREPQGAPGISQGRYPGSYPFPKGGRLIIQLSISSVLREMQGNDQKRF
ncbi:unnamed protein product [Prunus armeniaca]